MIAIDKPKNISTDQIKQFLKLVEMGGQVDTNGLMQRINSAELLGYYYFEDIMASIVAIKRPNLNYKNDIFKKAELGEQSNMFSLELGWAYTVDRFGGKGFCKELVKEILQKKVGSKIFATTSVENKTMQHILSINGFKIIGEPYQGSKNSQLLLFIKEQ